MTLGARRDKLRSLPCRPGSSLECISSWKRPWTPRGKRWPPRRWARRLESKRQQRWRNKLHRSCFQAHGNQ